MDRCGTRLVAERRRLTEAARDWRHHRDEELLYRGTRLADIARLRVQHAADLIGDEEEFLIYSARLEARRERARYLGQAAGGAVGTGLGYGAAFALGFAAAAQPVSYESTGVYDLGTGLC